MIQKATALIILLSAILLNAVGQSRNNSNSSDSNTPRFLPEYKADDYLKVQIRNKGEGVLIKWKAEKNCSKKIFHLLKGIVKENNEISWKIIKKIDPENENKFEYLDQDMSFKKAYYRIRVSQDEDNVEYTNYYLFDNEDYSLVRNN